MFFKRKSNRGKDNQEVESLSPVDAVRLEYEEKLKACRGEQVETLKQVNSLLKYITELDYVHDMLLAVDKQTRMVEGIASSSMQMTSSIEDISTFVESSNSKALESVETANRSMNDFDEAFEQINVTYEESRNVQRIMNDVNEEAQKITDMVGIIKGVADQTNLLALNASIEAARAGEHGRGFAVVADEIRKLAESTNQQVDFIQKVVANLSGKIEKSDEAITHSNQSFELGKEKMSTAVEGLEAMKSSLGGISSSFMEISANIEEQTAASQEMSSAVQIVNDQAKVMQEETNKTGMAFNAVSKVVDDMRLELLDSDIELNMKTQIEICISDHLSWRWKVYNMILGYEELEASQIGNHRTCRLGRWVEADNGKSEKVKGLLTKLDGPHAKLHEIGKHAIEAYNNGHRDKAEEYLAQMTKVSEEVVAVLKEMKKGDKKSRR